MSGSQTHASWNLAHTTAVVAVTGCTAFGMAAPAAADNTATDILVGGNQCGLAPPTSCQPSRANFTLPPLANATEVDWTANPNSCADLSVKVDEGGKAIGLHTVVPESAGPHSLTVTPTCSQPLSSWGGTLHVAYIRTTGTPVDPNGPQPPKNAIVVNVEQSPTSVSVNVKNTSALAGNCTYDAHPTNAIFLPDVHRDFHVNPNDSTRLDFLAPPPGKTYHLVITCHGTFNGQDDPFGHFEQDVTGGL